MSILGDDQIETKKDIQTVKTDERTGYERPLFSVHKLRWNDDGLFGGAADKAENRYHDKENTLKVLNGLSHDLFFRAEEVNRSEFSKIPDCTVISVKDKERKPPQKEMIKKPLDSKARNRTYILTPDVLEEPSRKPQPRKKKTPSRGRRPGRSR